MRNSLLQAKQSRKISELRGALLAAGFCTIEEQSRALGVCRSTGFTIVKAVHKGSGLSATIIKRMLAAPQLPLDARVKIFEYVEEKAAGQYGHSAAQCRKFIACIAAGMPPGDDQNFYLCCREARPQEGQTPQSKSHQPLIMAKQRVLSRSSR